MEITSQWTKPAKELLPFHEWFTDCAMIAIRSKEWPDAYVWDLKNPGQWWQYWATGFDPMGAVHCMFHVLGFHKWRGKLTLVPKPTE